MAGEAAQDSNEEALASDNNTLKRAVSCYKVDKVTTYCINIVIS